MNGIEEYCDDDVKKIKNMFNEGGFMTIWETLGNIGYKGIREIADMVIWKNGWLIGLQLG